MNELDELFDRLKQGGKMSLNDRFILDRDVHPTINNFLTKKLEPHERESVMMLEIENIISYVQICYLTFSKQDPLWLVEDRIKINFLQELNKYNYSENEKNMRIMLFGIKCIMNDNYKKPIEIQGKMPKKGLISFRQIEAGYWFKSYIDNNTDRLLYIYYHSEYNIERPKQYLMANTAHYFKKHYPDFFYSMPNETENDALGRIYFKVYNMSSFSKKVSNDKPDTFSLKGIFED